MNCLNGTNQLTRGMQLYIVLSDDGREQLGDVVSCEEPAAAVGKERLPE